MLLNRKVDYQVVVLLALTGCASSPPHPPPPVPAPTPVVPAPPPVVHTDCQKLALYAGSIASIRDVGVPREYFLKKKADATFPVEGVVEEVYSRWTQDPEQIHALFKTVCEERGYNRFMVTLRELKVERLLDARDVGATR